MKVDTGFYGDLSSRLLVGVLEEYIQMRLIEQKLVLF